MDTVCFSHCSLIPRRPRLCLHGTPGLIFSGLNSNSQQTENTDWVNFCDTPSPHFDCKTRSDFSTLIILAFRLWLRVWQKDKQFIYIYKHVFKHFVVQMKFLFNKQTLQSTTLMNKLPPGTEADQRHYSILLPFSVIPRKKGAR